MTTTPDNHERRLREALAAFRAGSPSELDRWRTELTLAFYAGELEQAQRVITGACGLAPAVTVLDDVLAPAMSDIGSLWEQDKITIADEHLATAVAHRLLAIVSSASEFAPAKTRETVLLATPPPERHTTGLLMAADVLYGAGYNTVLLGAGVPDDALRAALLRHEPALVGLSSTMPFPDAFAATATMVHEALPTVRLITGGASARTLPPAIPARHVGRLDGLLGTVEEMLEPDWHVSRAGADGPRSYAD